MAIKAYEHAFMNSADAPAPPEVAVEQKPVAYMRSDSKECTTATRKAWMESANFGVWDEVALKYTIPLYTSPAAPVAAGLPASDQIDKLRDLVLSIPNDRTMSHFATAGECRGYREGHKAALHAVAEMLTDFAFDAAAPVLSAEQPSQPLMPNMLTRLRELRTLALALNGKAVPVDGGMFVLRPASADDAKAVSVAVDRLFVDYSRMVNPDDDQPSRPQDRSGHDSGLLTELRRWAGDDKGYAACMIRSAANEIERLAKPSPIAESAPVEQQEITRLDIMSLIRQQCHRVYASAIDREEIDTKYMAEIEDALRNYSKNSSGCPAAPAGFDERESLIWALGYSAGKDSAAKPEPSPIAEPDTATKAPSESKKDAARLDFLEGDNFVVLYCYETPFGEDDEVLEVPRRFYQIELESQIATVEGDTARAAIDAAILANQTTKD